MSHALRRVASPEDWAALHTIRRATLFADGRHSPEIVYDENHPDDLHSENHCFLLTLDGRPIGVVRLDRRGDAEGVVRLVAIVPDLQGRVLDALLATEARRRGMSRLVLNVHSSAVGFYEKTGRRAEVWEADELAGIAADCVQMGKPV